MRRLRIGFICNTFPEISQTFVRDQIDFFCKRGHGVDVYVASHLIQNKILRKYDNYFGLSSNFQKVLFFPFYFINYLIRKPILIIKSLNFLKYGKQALYLKVFYATIFFSPKK
jgi:colanic acid/amylovoran biosynthesis glycosyltransferase